MTATTARILATAIADTNRKIDSGELLSRICRDCGGIHHAWQACGIDLHSRVTKHDH